MFTRENIFAFCIVGILLSVLILFIGRSWWTTAKKSKSLSVSVFKYLPLGCIIIFCLVIILLNHQSVNKQDVIAGKMDSIKQKIDTLSVHDPMAVIPLAADDLEKGSKKYGQPKQTRIDSLSSVYDASINSTQQKIRLIKSNIRVIDSLSSRASAEQFYTGEQVLVDSLKNVRSRYAGKVATLEMINQRYGTVKYVLDSVKEKRVNQN